MANAQLCLLVMVSLLPSIWALATDSHHRSSIYGEFCFLDYLQFQFLMWCFGWSGLPEWKALPEYSIAQTEKPRGKVVRSLCELLNSGTTSNLLRQERTRWQKVAGWDPRKAFRYLDSRNGPEAYFTWTDLTASQGAARTSGSWSSRCSEEGPMVSWVFKYLSVSFWAWRQLGP